MQDLQKPVETLAVKITKRHSKTLHCFISSHSECRKVFVVRIASTSPFTLLHSMQFFTYLILSHVLSVIHASLQYYLLCALL